MNKAINMRMMVVAAIAIIFTAVLCTVCYYRVFREEVMDDLEAYTRLLAGMSLEECEENEAELTKAGIRMTIIDKEGNVIFDNVADISGLENHRSRAEIQEAYKSGEGRSVRKSESLKHSNFYYAIMLEDGSVIRTAKETSSIYSIFGHAFPFVILITIVIFGICYVISRLLTRSIVQPIEGMARDMMSEEPTELEDTKVYKELQPVIERIRSQHADILRSADLRQEFTANVSHELKTPLTSISGYSELIENGMASEADTRKFAGEIHRSSERLLTLINDILRLSELDSSSGKGLTLEDVDLYDIALSCQVMLEPSAEKHNVKVLVDGSKCIVRADKTMMEELIYNLCDNAIRYNKDGGTVWIKAEDGVLEVKDNGIGISKENQERIFERFFRVDKSRSKQTGGTGLGLAIVKHIVEIHGASVSLESDVSEGTIVTVRF